MGKYGPPWDIIVVYNGIVVTRKKRFCESKQQTPCCSHFPVFLEEPSVTQDGW